MAQINVFYKKMTTRLLSHQWSGGSIGRAGEIGVRDLEVQEFF